MKFNTNIVKRNHRFFRHANNFYRQKKKKNCRLTTASESDEQFGLRKERKPTRSKLATEIIYTVRNDDDDNDNDSVGDYLLFQRNTHKSVTEN